MLKKPNHLQRGFTLVEIVVGIVLLLIIITMATMVFVENFRVLNAEQSFIDDNWQIRVALLLMRSDIRSAVRINTASSTTFAFVDNNVNSITYSLSNNQLLRTQSSAQLLADNISTANSSFTYYDKDGSNTAVIANMKYFIISLNSLDIHNDFTIKSTVYLWNKWQ